MPTKCYKPVKWTVKNQGNKDFVIYIDDDDESLDKDYPCKVCDSNVDKFSSILIPFRISDNDWVMECLCGECIKFYARNKLTSVLEDCLED